MTAAVPVLQGKTIFITGATGAIAEACALQLARDGAQLMLMARRGPGLDAVIARIVHEVPGARVHGTVGDAMDDDAVARAAQAAHDLDGRLDGAFATVGGGGFKPLIEHTAHDLRDAFDTNVVSAFSVIARAAPLMAPGGSIVCLSSGAAVLTFRHLGAYHIAKAALEGLVRMAADELGPSGLRVNAIRPGLTRSGATQDMFDNGATPAFLPEYPLGRLGEACDMAGAVRFLLGPESAWVTGQMIAVDGGNLLRRSPDLAPLPLANPNYHGSSQ